MEARDIRKLRESGLTIPAIAAATGRGEATIGRVLNGRYRSEQQQRADRAEALFGGILGPGTGNTCRRIVKHDDDQINREVWELGHTELTAPDPLDILIAEENIRERIEQE